LYLPARGSAARAGIATFRDAGGLWANYRPTHLKNRHIIQKSASTGMPKLVEFLTGFGIDANAVQ
jgi:NAD-dependent SIR2 family protein deacetylase